MAVAHDNSRMMALIQFAQHQQIVAAVTSSNNIFKCNAKFARQVHHCTALAGVLGYAVNVAPLATYAGHHLVLQVMSDGSLKSEAYLELQADQQEWQLCNSNTAERNLAQLHSTMTSNCLMGIC